MNVQNMLKGMGIDVEGFRAEIESFMKALGERFDRIEAKLDALEVKLGIPKTTVSLDIDLPKKDEDDGGH